MNAGEWSCVLCSGVKCGGVKCGRVEWSRVECGGCGEVRLEALGSKVAQELKVQR